MTFYNTLNSTMNNCSISPKKKFQILCNLMKNNKFSPIPPLIENNVTINDQKQKSEVFNNFFASKSKVVNANDEPPILERLENIKNLENINTSPIEVAKFIRGMKKSHSSYCGIPGKFLHIISAPISYSFSTLLNNMFEIGHFPEIWKIANVTPIYKRSGVKNEKENFCPISILPTLSKVCESVVHERLLSHCTMNNIISDRQAAYMRGDSTMTQLLYIVHFIRKNWGYSKIVQGAFLDISSAFDKVWHNGLIAKLSQIGIDGSLATFFKSYLSNRKQCVIIEGEKSTLLDIEAGVPQGSRLGPLLFIIYINDIINDIESEILLFADDTTLLASGKDPAETSAQINRDLIRISEWAKKWKVTFNAKRQRKFGLA